MIPTFVPVEREEEDDDDPLSFDPLVPAAGDMGVDQPYCGTKANAL